MKVNQISYFCITTLFSFFNTEGNMKNKNTVLLLIALFIINNLLLADNSYYFYVQLKDKNNSPYSLDEPLEFLSQRALDRRAFYNIALDESDLPVNPAYKTAIQNLDIHIHSSTKWLNGLTVEVLDSSKMADVRNLSFVEFVQFTGINSNYSQASPQKIANNIEENFDYGIAATQIDQLSGRYLHQKNYTGEGIYIAVLDAGFLNANTIDGFESMRNEGRLLAVKNIVDPNRSVYLEHSHGSSVLSTLAGVSTSPDYVGTAPKASYLLIQTEYNAGEFLCEPDFWVSGVEYADSVGVDVATTSLGYTEFDDSSMNYSYSDLDGNTARASIAANMAFEKGILMFNSAGNEGNKSWKYISVPADAAGVITVGSVTSAGLRSAFSSVGPTADSRLKPELAAMGSSSALLSVYGGTQYSNGTSFSCPILAGISACFLQATRDKAPYLSLEDVRQLIYQSASQYNSPDNNLGYGLPNFQEAYDSMIYTQLKVLNLSENKNQYTQKLVLDGSDRELYVQLPIDFDYSEKNDLTLFNATGVLLQRREINEPYVKLNTSNLQKGIYIIQLSKQ